MLSREPGPVLRLWQLWGQASAMGHSSVPTSFLLHRSFYQDGDLSTEDGPLKSKTCSQQDKSLNQEQFQAVCS